MEAHNFLTIASDASRSKGRGASNSNRGSIRINDNGDKGFKRREGSGGKGSRRGREATCQRHGNWEQNKVMALIKYKHIEHVIQKELINPRAHMVPIVVRWNKSTKEL
jgi:hypothetical protein